MYKPTGYEGELITASRAQELTEPYQKRERDLECRKDNLVHAEFFGLHLFKKLIDQYGDRCVGFRVYYGLRTEDHSGSRPVFGSGRDTSRLVIIPVDSEGDDILTETKLGLKDMAAPAEAMAGGPICPHVCGK